MKHAHRLISVISSSTLLCLPAVAQTSSGLQSSERVAGPGTQAMMFLRIPLGDASPHNEQGPSFGFGLFASCGAAMGLSSERNHEACEAAPLRSLEFSTGFNDEPWSLSFGSAGRRIEVINWSPRTGALSLAGDQQGSIDWMWVGLGAVGVGLAVALTADDDPLLCSGNTIPNPISGKCEPLVLG